MEVFISSVPIKCSIFLSLLSCDHTLGLNSNGDRSTVLILCTNLPVMWYVEHCFELAYSLLQGAVLYIMGV